MDEQDPQKADNGLSGDPRDADDLPPSHALASAALHRPATAAALSLVILPVLYRLGIVGSVVIVVLAVALNAVPETRQLFDAFLGKTPTGRSRLALVESLESRSASPDNTLIQHGSILDDDTFVDLQVGHQLHPPLSKLIDLVQRDFISYWYDTSVALSTNTPFPKYTRSMLNCIINNLVERMKRQDPKEVSIYLFHSLSNAIITQLRQDEDEVTAEQLRSDKDVLIRKVRRTSEELMLTLGPRSSTSSPLVLALLTEVISLQIWSTIQSLNSDYINTAIVDNFGEAVTLAKEAQQEAKAAAVNIPIVEEVQAPAPYAGPPPAVPSKESHMAQNGDPSMAARAPSVTSDTRSPPEQTIRFDDPDHTIATAGMPGIIPNLDLVQPRSSSESARKASIASPTSSQPGSPRSLQKKRLEDQTLEEALENGAARFRAFGKNLMSAGHKFLDAALPLDETLGTPQSPTTASGTRLKSLPASRSGVGGVTGAGPSRKGKEREIDPIEPIRSPLSPASSIQSGSPTSSLRAMSIDAGTSRASSSSAVYGGSSSRPSSMIGKSGAMSRSSSAHSSLFASTGPQSQQPQTPVSPAARIQRILDSLEGGTPEQHQKLVKQIEISLFSKDLSLLFPEDPPDEQLRAVLMRHTASDESIDPSLIELSDAFHEYLEKDGEDGKTGELVLRMWTLLDHFGYMVDITHPDEGQIKGDALQLLKKIIAQARDLETAFQKDSHEQENTEALEKSYWTAVEMAILRLEQNPNREIFDPLKDWLLRFIQVSYWDRFLRANLVLAGASGVAVSAAPPRLTRVPSASTSKRTLNSIGSSAPAAKPLQDDSYDIADGMHVDDTEEVSVPLSRQASSHAQGSALSRTASQDLPNNETAATALSGMTSPTSSTNGDLPSIPSFSVSITDLSPPTAYQNNHVKNRKDLEFLIAVEVEGSPGYILARKYVEFEKMDQGIKKALPQSGTKAFPRAPLPSTNFQTSENLCKSLESYLEALLREPRYANCDPVARFFAKERTDSKTGVVNPLVFLGQGVNNIGKGVTEVGKGIGRSGEMATRSFATGFNQLTNTITAIPGLKRTSSGHMEGGPATPTKSGSAGGTGSPIIRRSSADSLSAPAASASRQSLTSPSTTSLATSISSVKEEEEDSDQRKTEAAATKEVPDALKAEELGQSEPLTQTTVTATSPVKAAPPLPPRPESPGGYEIPDTPLAVMKAESKIVKVEQLEPTKQPGVDLVEPEIPAGLHYQPRKKVVVHDDQRQNSQHQQGEVAEVLAADIGGRMSFDELLEKDRELQIKMAEKETAKEQSLSDPASVRIEKTPSGQEQKGAASKAQAQSSSSAPANLSAIEFSNVLSFAMAILEEAYELSDGAWNLRRGILRVLETVLRTSYAGVIRAGMTKLVQSVSEEEFYVKQIDKLRESFWPPPDNVWWSSVEGYIPAKEKTPQEKEATRLEARRLLQLQAPEGLKVALGPTATTVAIGRLHDSLQGPGAEAIVSSMMLDYLRLLLL